MSIEQRLQKLERSNCRWRTLAVAALVVLILASCSSRERDTPRASASKPENLEIADTIRTRGIIIHDRDDKPVGSFYGMPGGAWLTLGSKTESRSISLYTFGDYTSLEVSSPSGKTTLNGASIELSRVDEGKKRQFFRLHEKNKGIKSSDVPDEEQKILDRGFHDPRVVIGLGEGGGGMVDVYNVFSKPVVAIQSNKANRGAVYVNDVNGKSGNVLGVQ